MLGFLWIGYAADPCAILCVLFFSDELDIKLVTIRNSVTIVKLNPLIIHEVYELRNYRIVYRAHPYHSSIFR